ncbi:hypothetical protein ASG88_16750 [Nocardioides sp. Soil777]|uniref:hypothetical protein n=1 Tax=Nocardioides sp. Soil777 TaxID=1736409 RepID=UPI0007039077|nr:hypothetical protein [Nocardioides sp. Soil777]KRE98698.1 hypothetical protein ASG88_16750 [Nocardioides sp. Soil777]
MRRLLGSLLLLPLVLLLGGPASAEPVGAPTVVDHDVTFTAVFDGDICGPRANTTTFHRTMEQVQFFQRPDGTFSYRDVAVVTYVSDYDDPALPDLTGRLTEVNRFVATPGKAFVGVTTFHDFFGEVRIFYRFHTTQHGEETVVEREVLKVTGCP